MKKWNLQLSKCKGKYFVYSANTCMNSTVKSIVKMYCYSEVNILNTTLTNLAVTSSNIWALFGMSNAFEVVVGNMPIHMIPLQVRSDVISRYCEHQSG